MSSANNNHIISLMCLTRSRFAELVQHIEDSGYEVIITSSYRTSEKQQELYKQLKNQENGRAAKKSKHEYGIAIDINLKKGSKLWKKSTAKSEWEATGVPGLAKKLGFRWGGDFSGNFDPVHFDLGKDFSVNKLTGALESVTTGSEDIAFSCKIESFFRQYVKDRGE